MHDAYKRLFFMTTPNYTIELNSEKEKAFSQKQKNSYVKVFLGINKWSYIF